MTETTTCSYGLLRAPVYGLCDLSFAADELNAIGCNTHGRRISSRIPDAASSVFAAPLSVRALIADLTSQDAGMTSPRLALVSHRDNYGLGEPIEADRLNRELELNSACAGYQDVDGCSYLNRFEKETVRLQLATSILFPQAGQVRIEMEYLPCDLLEVERDEGVGQAYSRQEVELALGPITSIKNEQPADLLRREEAHLIGMKLVECGCRLQGVRPSDGYSTGMGFICRFRRKNHTKRDDIFADLTISLNWRV